MGVEYAKVQRLMTINETFAALTQGERVRLRKFYRKERKFCDRYISKIEAKTVARDIVHMKETLKRRIAADREQHEEFTSEINMKR